MIKLNSTVDASVVKTSTMRTSTMEVSTMKSSSNTIVKPLTLSSVAFGTFLTITAIAAAIGLGTTTSASDFTDTISLDVAAVCTMEASVSGTTHSGTLLPGQFTGDIGLTNVNASCNDTGGYAVYAIGYTNNEYGNTNLINTTDATNTIPTGTTTGSNSNWSMKLGQGTGDSATITGQTSGDTEDFYNNYHIVPSTYTKVAAKPSATDPTITGTAFTTTYGAYISSTQVAGTYTGQVKYTLVHPNTAPAPETPWTPQPEEATPKCISYWPNGRDVTDSMDDDCNAGPSGSGYGNNATAELWASNFQNPGYGFAGWSDKYDWALNQNDASGNGTGPNQGYHIYGPNYTITTPSDMTTNGLSLYAVWVPSAGDLQSWTGCSSMTTGQVTALTDTRDQQTYAVARLADGNCWMIENLRLDNQYTTSSTDIAKAQGYNSSFIGLADPENTLNWYTTASNSLYSIDGSTAAPAITGDYQEWRFPRYNNQNTASPATNMTAWTPVSETYDSGQNTYSVGNWYTWAAAVADTSLYPDGATSICPAGWHIPTGYGEYEALNNVVNAGATNTSIGLRRYPVNYIYSGDFGFGSPDDRGLVGRYWSSLGVSGSSTAYCFNVFADGNYVDEFSRAEGASIRCLAD